VQGCAVCHTGKVLGTIVPGLGNKNIDPAYLAGTGKSVQDWTEPVVAWLGSDVVTKQLNDGAREFCSRISDPRFETHTQGMVSVAAIRDWVYREAGTVNDSGPSPGLVKVPSLWGFGAKREAGLFCDGMGQGSGWLAMVDLVAGQTPQSIEGLQEKLSQIESQFSQLLPPTYPLPIDWERASRGKQVFHRNCSECHGTYAKDENRLPIFDKPKRVDLDDVRTDADRVSGNTDRFIAAVNSSPLADRMSFRSDYRPGYLAPRLEGVWARFPYLHNGSVPNLAALLTSPSERPVAFDLRDAGEVRRFDPDRVGLTVPPEGSQEERDLQTLAKSGVRYIYDVRRTGHSNRGHEFGLDCTAEEKRDLIEYLKTL
jgi:hypothetical protein